MNNNYPINHQKHVIMPPTPGVHLEDTRNTIETIIGFNYNNCVKKHRRTDICIHKKYKCYCYVPECKKEEKKKGAGLCEHDQNKYFCDECKITEQKREIDQHNQTNLNCDVVSNNDNLSSDDNVSIDASSSNDTSGLGNITDEIYARCYHSCEHGLMKCLCDECKYKKCDHTGYKTKQRKMCHHGKIEYYCKKCRGEGICHHNKNKYFCVDCGGKGMCVHGKYKYYCKDCGGKGICKHGVVKFRCRDCDHGQFCIHDRRKYYCKDCGGNAICSHNKVKYSCKVCKVSKG